MKTRAICLAILLQLLWAPGLRAQESLWGSAEYLMWWSKGRTAPPLVTTSPDGTPRMSAAILGQPATSTLLGGGDLGTDLRHGGRLTLGSWFEQNQMGIGGSFFAIGDDSDDLQVSSPNGSPIVGRPFFDVLLNAQNVSLVGFPNVATGTLQVDVDNEIIGSDLFVRVNVLSGQGYSVDAIGGYSFFRVDDSINLVSSSTAGPLTALPGTVFDVRDTFDVRNRFHGGEVGVTGNIRNGRFSLAGLVKLSVGETEQTVAISGATTITRPGMAPAQFPNQGLLALNSNSGIYRQRVTTLVPEIGLTAGYRATDNLRLTLGYHMIYWSRMALAGDQIDLNVNTSQLPGAIVTVPPPVPAFKFADTDFWVMGLTLGGEFTF